MFSVSWANLGAHVHVGRFLFNNYKQALDIINKGMTELAKFKALMSFDDNDFEAWHREELVYLKDCTSEPATASISVAYIVELEKL
jgi:hypothetical protein